MKRTVLNACLAIFLLGIVKAAEPSASQDQLLVAAIKEIQTQQTAIADNQAKIDAKLVSVAEALRVARIYSSRGGH